MPDFALGHLVIRSDSINVKTVIWLWLWIKLWMINYPADIQMEN